MYLAAVFAFFCTLFYTPCQIGAFEWTDSLPDGTQLEVCEENSAIFDWGYRLAPGERVDTISYHQQLQYFTPDNASETDQEDEMGTPIVSTDPHFTFTPDHQMIINRATVKDTGNYVIKVMVDPAGEKEAQLHVSRASLLVKASPLVDKAGMQAKLQPEAVMVIDGPQPGWQVKLSCGTFLSLGHPAVTARWTTPSGTVLPSTSYENGVFSLIVPNPVESGDYSCQVDPRAPVLDCVSDKSPLRHQPAVRVDDMEYSVIRKTRSADLTAKVTQLFDRMDMLDKFVYSSTCKSSKALYPLSGVQTLNIDATPVQVYCDQDTDGGGWTIIQRRQNGQVEFYRGWDEYVSGFGDVNNEYWLGLEKIHQITSRWPHSLRVVLWTQEGIKVYAMYERFSLGGASDNYRLNISGYSGTAGDSMLNTGVSETVADKMQFSTHDRDNDQFERSCAIHARGAWWYNKCRSANLNGEYSPTDRRDGKGIIWYNYKNDVRTFVRTEMKIRPL